MFLKNKSLAMGHVKMLNFMQVHVVNLGDGFMSYLMSWSGWMLLLFSVVVGLSFC